MYVCVCHAVTEHEIESAIDGGACSIEHLQEELHVSTCCGACQGIIECILEEKIAAGPNPPPPGHTVHDIALGVAV